MEQGERSALLHQGRGGARTPGGPDARIEGEAGADIKVKGALRHGPDPTARSAFALEDQ